MGDVDAMRANVGEVVEAGGYRPVTLETAEGDVYLRWCDAASSLAVAYVGGAGDGWDSPSDDLYPRLCGELMEQGVSGLRVRFRSTRDLTGCVHDLLAGMAYLRHSGASRVALVGHSMGGAVVIRAATGSPEVETVVCLATQSHGADAGDLPRGCSLLLIHGERDTVVPASASEHVFATAREPKRLLLLPNDGHMLAEDAGIVHDEVRDWLLAGLA